MATAQVPHYLHLRLVDKTQVFLPSWCLDTEWQLQMADMEEATCCGHIMRSNYRFWPWCGKPALGKLLEPDRRTVGEALNQGVGPPPGLGPAHESLAMPRRRSWAD